MLKTEDSWAIIIGGLILCIGLALFFTNAPDDYAARQDSLDEQLDALPNAPFKTLEWYEIVDEQKKIRIIEVLWQIVYSDKVADIYETNLMRRLAGLLYIDSKIMGDIKDKIKNKNL